MSSRPTGLFIKAHLPNQQRTTVHTPAGMTIREALSKALRLRKLEPEMCSVYKYSSQTGLKQRIDWDVDVSMLRGDEIYIETKDRVPMHTQLSHNFAKSFFLLSKCHFCQELLMTGYRCVTCGIEFHPNCGKSIPLLCEPAIENRNLFRHLLARSNGFSPPPLTDSPTDNSRPSRPRAKSADENSKHKTKSVNHNNGTKNQENTQTSPVDLNSPQPAEHNVNNVVTFSNHPVSPIHNLYNQDLPFRNQYLNQHLQPPSSHHQSELLEEKWEIDGDEITREGPCIGRGSFGTVYKGNWHGPVALKELNVKNPTPAQLEAFQNEVVVLKSTRHNNVMLFMGYVLKPALTIVTQWCEGRSLYKHLHVDDTVNFSKKKIIGISRGVAQGMEYLHARNIIHRDLKSSNIFLHDDLTVKIGDFGLATVKTRWEGNTQKHHPTGSVQWMAPEVIRTQLGVNPFTFQADVYSYGNVLYELLTRKLPYFDFTGCKEALLYQIGAGRIQLNLSVIESDKPKGLKALMMRCVKREVNDRPLFKDILREIDKIELRIPKLLRTTSEPLRLNDFDELMPVEG